MYVTYLAYTLLSPPPTPRPPPSEAGICRPSASPCSLIGSFTSSAPSPPTAHTTALPQHRAELSTQAQERPLSSGGPPSLLPLPPYPSLPSTSGLRARARLPYARAATCQAL